MFINLLKKKRVLVGLTIAMLAVAGAAFAYFTSSGEGTGKATVGSSSTIALSSDAITGLFPGGAAVPVTVHVHNPGGGAEFVNTISGTVADNGECKGSWFTVSPITYKEDVGAEASGPDAKTTVTMTDTGGNQDACQGLGMTINWSSN
jgi:hypothetical protein